MGVWVVERDGVDDVFVESPDLIGADTKLKAEGSRLGVGVYEFSPAFRHLSPVHHTIDA